MSICVFERNRFQALTACADENKSTARNPSETVPTAATPQLSRTLSANPNPPISGAVLAGLEKELKGKENNEQRLEHLDGVKNRYLFGVEQISLFMDVTPSIKTKMGIVERPVPRCIDPKNTKVILAQVRRAYE